MQWIVDGEPIEFIPLRQFRAEHALPESFSVAHFEPKSYEGLGSLDHAAHALQLLRGRLLDHAIPPRQLPQLIPLVDHLQATFDSQLRLINDDIGLREPEIGFAAAGFGDALRAMVYATIRQQGAVDVKAVYREWLLSTLTVASQIHTYEALQIQIVSHVYGRMGMRVTLPDGAVMWVADVALACPAEGFMMQLILTVGSEICRPVA